MKKIYDEVSAEFTERAQRMDDFDKLGIADKLTIEEVDCIVQVYAHHMEHALYFGMIFGTSIPESTLPYPLPILLGALDSMERYQFERGNKKAVKSLQETKGGLLVYTNDEEAITQAAKNLNDSKFREGILKSLKDVQEVKMEEGFLIRGEKHWVLSETRRNELLAGE